MIVTFGGLISDSLEGTAVRFSHRARRITDGIRDIARN